ncbi:MAG TPA: DUF1932 domain-containing protein [Sphingomonas sp.]|jgi:3-hydroxyisobutyrate dehydrogenase-like beta-hydroxyacid dehydrogenase|uniref:NAD(P)-dependent oxidoreductase n=1 Tax=Sphingomonas sp. TaxID=28214 RepID=UPI002EDBA5AB
MVEDGVQRLAYIGFGEAGMAFAAGLRGGVAYDRKTDLAETAQAKRDDYAARGVTGADSSDAAVAGATLILSLVTADQALAAARAAAAAITPGALFCDLNSVAPDTKRAAAAIIMAAGGRYVDVAVMAPVDPAGRAVPLLIAGPHAAAARVALATAGFTRARVLDGPVGAASSVKMIRSVMVKGLEALTTECFLAAEAAGVLDEVAASLDASWPGTDWAAKADYNLDRMMVHGLRRAAEMEEVVKTLDVLGTGSAMTRGTVARQRAVGALALVPAPGLDAKLRAVGAGHAHGPESRESAASAAAMSHAPEREQERYA